MVNMLDRSVEIWHLDIVNVNSNPWKND